MTDPAEVPPTEQQRVDGRADLEIKTRNVTKAQQKHEETFLDPTAGVDQSQAGIERCQVIVRAARL